MRSHRVAGQIQLGKQDVMFAGAGENECWEFTAMFDAMGALSTQYNDSPKTASRAFDKTRDGCEDLRLRTPTRRA